MIKTICVFFAIFFVLMAGKSYDTGAMGTAMAYSTAAILYLISAVLKYLKGDEDSWTP